MQNISGDAAYLEIVLKAVRVCAHYQPKFGQRQSRGLNAGLTLDAFQALYGGDAFYAWFGLDNPLMYAAHKAAGGMTSVYRQIGIGAEKLVRTIIQDSLSLSQEQATWSYRIPVGTSQRTRKLSLDARIPLEPLGSDARSRVQSWMSVATTALRVDADIATSLKGIVMEIRQGYKSKDSKRQNADIANAATAYTKAYLPCAMILSSQIDDDLLERYRRERWIILTGQVGGQDPHASTYDFMRDVVGYDLAAFFERNARTLRTEVDAVLRRLLTPSS